MVLEGGGGPGGEVRFEEWDAYEAGSKKAKSADVFFWQHDRVLWIFSPRRSAFTVQLKRTAKGKNTWTSMHLILLKTKKKLQGAEKRTVDWLKANLWTDNCSGCYFTTVYVISKCRKCLFVFFVTDSVYLLVWKIKQPKPLQNTGVEETFWYITDLIFLKEK